MLLCLVLPVTTMVVHGILGKRAGGWTPEFSVRLVHVFLIVFSPEHYHYLSAWFTHFGKAVSTPMKYHGEPSPHD